MTRGHKEVPHTGRGLVLNGVGDIPGAASDKA